MWMLPLNLLLGLFGNKYVKGILNVVIKHWKIVLIALFIAGFVYSYWSLKRDHLELIKDYQEAESINERYAEENERLLRRVEEQNSAVVEYKRKGDEVERRLQEAMDQNERVVHEYDQALINLSMQPPEDASCEASVKWLIDTKDKYKW